MALVSTLTPWCDAMLFPLRGSRLFERRLRLEAQRRDPHADEDDRAPDDLERRGTLAQDRDRLDQREDRNEVADHRGEASTEAAHSPVEGHEAARRSAPNEMPEIEHRV